MVYRIDTYPQPIYQIDATQPPQTFPWVPDGASLFIDFENNRAYKNDSVITSVDAVNLTRAGSVLMLGPDGYQSFPANTLARIDGIGAQVAPARTNKCLNFNANPVDLTGVTKSGDAAATLTVVDDEAALRADGFGRLIDEGKMNGEVFKLDNSAGTTNAFVNLGGVTGNTNTHVVSAVMRGSGNGVLRAFSFIVPSQPFPPAYTRVVTTAFAPSNSTVQGMIQVDPGAVVYFILNQLEEGSYASPPIITSGAAVSRPGDILRDSVPDGMLAYGVAGWIKVNILQPSVPADFGRVLQIGVGTEGVSNVQIYDAGDGTIRFGLTKLSVGQASMSIGPWMQGEQTIVFAAGPNFACVRRVGSAVVAPDTSVDWPEDLSLIGIGGWGGGTSRNVFSHPGKLTLFAASPSKPINQSFFDEVYQMASAS